MNESHEMQCPDCLKKFKIKETATDDLGKEKETKTRLSALMFLVAGGCLVGSALGLLIMSLLFNRFNLGHEALVMLFAGVVIVLIGVLILKSNWRQKQTLSEGDAFKSSDTNGLA